MDDHRKGTLPTPLPLLPLSEALMSTFRSPRSTAPQGTIGASKFGIAVESDSRGGAAVPTAAHAYTWFCLALHCDDRRVFAPSRPDVVEFVVLKFDGEE